MCYNCACHIKDDNMGNPDNITEETFKRAATAWGQTVDSAKLNTYNLLKEDLEKKGLLPVKKTDPKAQQES